MFQNIRSFFAAPIFEEEEKTLFAKQLIYVTHILLISTTLFNASASIFSPSLRSYVVLAVLWYATIFGTYFLVHKKLLRESCLLLTAGLWIILSITAAISGGVSSSAFEGNIIVIIIAALLSGKTAVAIFAGLGIASGALMVYGQEISILPVPPAELNKPLVFWLAQAIYLVVVILIMRISTEKTERALVYARSELDERKKLEGEQAQLLSKTERRAVQLQTVAEVSRAISTILDLDVLLRRVVELIREHFNFYYVGLFLIDHTKQRAVLHAATGEMGEQMLQAHHALETNHSSMIGWCIANKQARIALDVGKDAVRFNNPFLPLTRSEIALPLVSRGEVIGGMSIQSDKEAAFSEEDITTLQAMADHVANAIENARLFTERSTLINELGTRNAELERFTYTVSHDLRAPLITIRGFLGFLEQDALSGDPERVEKDVQRIVTATEKMQQLLSELLELSRAGRALNPPEEIPFQVIVQEAVELVRGRLDANVVNVEIEENLPNVHGDHFRLVEVIQNLVDNAAKFMGDQPNKQIQIGMQGKESDGKAIFFVRDNGIGIDPKFHEQVFGLFNKLDSQSEGTGVGLALVKRIIEFHDGRIWIDSDGKNGATFYFTLP